jgi:hypothetical protein
VSQELDWNRTDICRVTKGAHIEHLKGRTETWSVSPSVDMLPFGVTIPATVPQGSEIPEGLMNNRVYEWSPALKMSLGRPKNRWEDDVKCHITKMKITNWRDCIKNRSKWKEFVEKAKTSLGL